MAYNSTAIGELRIELSVLNKEIDNIWDALSGLGHDRPDILPFGSLDSISKKLNIIEKENDEKK